MGAQEFGHEGIVQELSDVGPGLHTTSYKCARGLYSAAAKAISRV